MGWDGMRATCYRRDGSIDRKAECDKEHTWDYEGRKSRVLKSTMVGSVYYAALEITEKDDRRKVIGCVDLTRVDNSQYCNFYMKSMSEDMEPYYYDCPASILDLLTPREDADALRWREKCREKLRRRKEQPQLGKLPIGTVIEFELRGERVKFCKAAPNFQFKRPFWTDGVHYISKKYIPEDFRVVKTA